MLYKVSDVREIGMPAVALVGSREDAVTVARALGLGDHAHVEMVDTGRAAMLDAVRSFRGGRPHAQRPAGVSVTGYMGPSLRGHAPAEGPPADTQPAETA